MYVPATGTVVAGIVTAPAVPVVPSIVITDTALATEEKSIPKATDRVMTNNFCENGGDGVFI